MGEGLVDRDATATPGAVDQEGYGQKVPAVDQAARILYHLADDVRGQATLTEICRAVGIYKSKGRALLNTLIAANLITRSDPEKTYSLGPGLLVLSRALLDQTDLTRAAGPFLERLAVVRGACAFLALIRGDQVYVAARREAPGGMSVTIRIGYHYPLTWGSMGKAIVASLPEDERERILADGSSLYFRGDPATRPVDLDTVRQEFAECRRLGYAVDLGDIQPGLHALSAPLYGSDGPEHPVGVVVLVGTFPPEDAPAAGGRVAETAAEMRRQLCPLLDGVGWAALSAVPGMSATAASAAGVPGRSAPARGARGAGGTH